MDFFGVGPLEIFFIVIIALIVLGPKDMVKAGKTLGRMLRKLITSPTWRAVQDTSRQLRNLPTKLMRDAGMDEIQAELKSELNDVNKASKALKESLSQDMKVPGDKVDLSSWTTTPQASSTPSETNHESPAGEGEATTVEPEALEVPVQNAEETSSHA